MSIKYLAEVRVRKDLILNNGQCLEGSFLIVPKYKNKIISDPYFENRTVYLIEYKNDKDITIY